MGALISCFFSDDTSSDSTDGRNTDVEPKPGDLIEFDRGYFKHWGVYVGHGKINHLVVTERGSDSSGVTFPGKTGIVKEEPLENVAGTSDWKVNNNQDKTYKPRPVNDILQEAKKWVGKHVEYDIKNNNCEHHATYLRYGKRVSTQVQNVQLAALGTVGFLGSVSLAASAATPNRPSSH
ncbi:phospholipase A and acyltransferase 3-like [Melanotaenia boesemani]|uniref:phospholipase A and acyltransferase 3-like n=1 Tax=Melanotaenia boesemani TaxID=1250792 RepID=UPI001C04F2BD|nr:phospholipase A and acyltransferase 3-like [Melanotaenia boesemani]